MGGREGEGGKERGNEGGREGGEMNLEGMVMYESIHTYQHLGYTVLWYVSSEEISGDEAVASASRDTACPAFALRE